MSNDVHNIQRKHWVSRFRLVGRPLITNLTFKIDEQSKRSSYVYNSMNIGIDCGEQYGVCYADMMGGYAPDNPMPIRVHGVSADGKGTDFANRFEVDWEDRNDQDVIDTVGSMDLIKVGLEKKTNGSVYIKNFLSAYDAIQYIMEHLTDDMVVNVIGNIGYHEYNGIVRMRRTITGIYLRENVEPSDFGATFVQTVLLSDTAASLSDIDKDTCRMPVDGIVLDYVREVNGNEIRGQWPYHYSFEFEFNKDRPDTYKRIYDITFKPKKGYLKQTTFEGKFVSVGATKKATWDDVPEETKEFVNMGLYSKEEVLEKLATNGPRVERAIIFRPYQNKDGVLQIFSDTYTEHDVDVSWAYDNVDGIDDDDIPFDSGASAGDGSIGDDDDMSWLDNM